MAKVLVTYYSRSGTAQVLALQLAARLAADVDVIAPAKGYAGVLGYLRGIWHSLRRRAPAIDCQKNPTDYALVVIASPVWAGRLSAPMRSYLKRFGGRMGALAAMWVSGSGLEYKAVAEEIERLAGRAPSVTASFAEREVRAGKADGKLDTLAQMLRLELREAA